MVPTRWAGSEVSGGDRRHPSLEAAEARRLSLPHLVASPIAVVSLRGL